VPVRSHVPKRRFTFPGSALTVNRIGYGAMQFTGPGVWGPPKDLDAAVAVLREALTARREPHRHSRFRPVSSTQVRVACACSEYHQSGL
jgi:hypothetical protein